MNFIVPADHRVKIKESDMRNEYLDLAWELRTLWNMRVITIVIGTVGTVPEVLEELKIRGQDHLNYSIVEIGQNTEKSLGDQRRLAVTQTPAKDYQLALV